MIAFLGTGLMGTGFIHAFRARGESVQAWNRTGSRAAPLAAGGVAVCSDPASVVRGAARVHLSLSDDAAVDAVLEEARAGLQPGAWIVDHTTTAPLPTALRHRTWTERGFRFVHAPVFMGPKNAHDATGLMLTCGDAHALDELRPELQKMSGRLLHVGDGAERAAAFKLFGNLMIVVITSGLGDVFALAKGLGIDALAAHALFDSFKVANTLDLRGKRMAQGDFAPTFELNMARKDVRLMLETADATGAKLELLPAVAAQMERLLAQGLGAQDLGVLARRIGAGGVE